MITISKLSVRSKLLLITVGLTFITLMTVMTVGNIGNYMLSKSEIRERIDVLANLTSQSLISSLDFFDPEAAQENMKSLRFEDSVVKACAYDLTKTIFSSYEVKKGGVDYSCSATYEEEELVNSYRYISVAIPILKSENERVGFLVMRYNLDEFNDGIIWNLFVNIIILLIVMTLVYIAAGRIQRIISHPVINLEKAARQFVKDEDFSIQVEKTSDDELGSMIDAFNMMVKKMEEREHVIVRSREDAESANKMKSKFLANMSHELRTPLNSIMGMTELIIETEDVDPEVWDMSKVIYKSSQNLLDIVNDILDISKIESGAFTLESKELDFKNLTNNLVEAMMPIASQKGVTLSCSYLNESLPVIKGDSLRLNQIMTNLVGNAIKYINDPYNEADKNNGSTTADSQGFVQVNVDYQALDDKRIQLYVEVKDNGIGISEDKIATIFEKFRQADDTITRRFGGTGLGLTITQDLVHMMGGEIGVKSTFGLGSLFWFKIPFETSDSAAEDLLANNNIFSVSIAGENRSDRICASKVRVLVAEDVVLNQHYVSRLLKHIGINNFKIAANGEIVLADYQDDHYDLILMDCHMPLKNGYQATKDIREIEKTKGEDEHIPVIAMTADAMKGAEEKCFEAGMDGYIAKPVEIKYLKEVLSTWVDFSKQPEGKEVEEESLTKNEMQPPVDLRLIKGFIGNQVEVGNFVNMFRAQGDDFLRKLNGTCKGGESKEWVEIAHGFKGCSMMIGAKFLVEHLQNAEEQLVANKSERSKTLGSIQEEYDNVVSFLENIEH